MMANKQAGSELERRIAELYEREGYKVDVQPQPGSLPFDLGAYEPDIVVKLPNGEHLVIEVKTANTNLDVDRMRAVAETVTRHPGWRFLLVTDVERTPLPEVGSGAEPLTPAQIKQRLTRVDLLIDLGETEGAYLSLWSTLEAMLRRRAEDVKLPSRTHGDGGADRLFLFRGRAFHPAVCPATGTQARARCPSAWLCDTSGGRGAAKAAKNG